MTRFDDHPNADEQRLAGQLVTLARSQFSALSVDAVGIALAQNRIRTVEAILENLNDLTPLDFGGEWLYKRSVIEVVEGAVDPW